MTGVPHRPVGQKEARCQEGSTLCSSMGHVAALHDSEPAHGMNQGPSEKGSNLMSTLKFTLEEVACLGEEYVVNEGGYEWSAKELLGWLERSFPDLLQLHVHFLPPTLGRDGAIYEADQEGEVIGGVPLYWIQRRPASNRTLQGIPRADAQPHPESG